MHSGKQIVALLLFASSCLISCGAANNYSNPEEPVFQGSFSEVPTEFDGVLSVVSYNIKFAEDIDSAIRELSESENLMDADIILLQEMDDAGTKEIAQALNYNYVYFPATVHHHHGRNFGNAILSRWPISSPEKVILPHKSPINQQIRVASKATVSVDETDVLAYSIHTETFFTSPRYRKDQIDYIVKDIDDHANLVVVGGDFNTATPSSIKYVDDRFGNVGMIRATESVGNTAQYGPFDYTLDHIYSGGMPVIEAGKVEGATASDHLPIWAKFALE